jgi:two-component system CheB/CheR fusion protein
MPLTIVGIGASAGGLEAIAELLGGLSAGTGMAYIVVQHLDPRHESLLSEILAKKSAIPVSVAL